MAGLERQARGAIGPAYASDRVNNPRDCRVGRFEIGRNRVVHIVRAGCERYQAKVVPLFGEVVDETRGGRFHRTAGSGVLQRPGTVDHKDHIRIAAHGGSRLIHGDRGAHVIVHYSHKEHRDRRCGGGNNGPDVGVSC